MTGLDETWCDSVLSVECLLPCIDVDLLKFGKNCVSTEDTAISNLDVNSTGSASKRNMSGF